MQLIKYSYEYPYQDCDNFLNLHVPVCKDFFSFCSGFGKKGFNKLLNLVENYDNENRPESPCDKYFRKEGLRWAIRRRTILQKNGVFDDKLRVGL